MKKVYIVYGRSDSYRDAAQCYTWIEGAFESFDKAKKIFLDLFEKTREFFDIPEEEAEQPIFHGTHGEAYLDGEGVERWLELVEVEVE